MLKELTLLGKYDLGFLCQGLQEISVPVGPTEFGPPKKPLLQILVNGVRWDLVPFNL